MNKIRIIDQAIQKAQFNLESDILNANYSYTLKVLKRRIWTKILAVTNELENIFAIPPIILTPYIHKAPLSKQTFYNLVDPMNSTSDSDGLITYITELNTLLYIDEKLIFQVTNINNDYVQILKPIARYENYLSNLKTGQPRARPITYIKTVGYE